MPKYRIAYFAHSLRSDWNNGNAHFLRGLLRAMVGLGHEIATLEREQEWSINNLLEEPLGAAALENFARVYSDLQITTYPHITTCRDKVILPDEAIVAALRRALQACEIVILHEWNPPELVRQLLALREELGFRLLFHDTHHRASSSPERIRLFALDKFDGIIAFGETLRHIYKERLGMRRVWTLHEAADTTVFHPQPNTGKLDDIVWIGNWGDGERSSEIRDFLLCPASRLPAKRAVIYGVRYPDDGLQALREANVAYRGYLPNLDAPRVYAQSRLTVHIPRREYLERMDGIPTIRVFEALACGIPLLSAPWRDTERLFRKGDFCFVDNAAEMHAAMRRFLNDTAAAEAMAARGLETVLARHTCHHRAAELSAICEEALA